MESLRAECAARAVLWQHVWLFTARYMQSTVLQQHFIVLEARTVGLQR